MSSCSTDGQITSQDAFFLSLKKQGEAKMISHAASCERREDMKLIRSSGDASQTAQKADLILATMLARDSLKFSPPLYSTEANTDFSFDSRSIQAITLYPPSWGAESDNNGLGRELTIEEQRAWIQTAIKTATRAATDIDSEFKVITYLFNPNEPRSLRFDLLDTHQEYLLNPLEPHMRLDHLPSGYQPEVGALIDFQTQNYILPGPFTWSDTLISRANGDGFRTPENETSPPIEASTTPNPSSLRRSSSPPALARPNVQDAATSPHTKPYSRRPSSKLSKIHRLLSSPKRPPRHSTPKSKAKKVSFTRPTATRKFEFNIYQMFLAVLASALTGFLLAFSLKNNKQS